MIDPLHSKYTVALQKLLSIMNELRDHCPWDRKQTWESLRTLTIEETYELSEAILASDVDEVKKELGDLMLHIVFYAKIADERELFDLADIIQQLCEKLIARHPHVYGSTNVNDADEVKKNWELLKLAEKPSGKGVLAGVPKSQPALLKALRIQEKVHNVGFDWQVKEEVWHKVEEELAEFKAVFHQAEVNPKNAEEEFGDLLFSLVNFARFVNINPETALERTNNKFIKRFNYIEEAAQRDGKTLSTMTLAEMDAYWEEAKRLE
jgi:XTP/dITP diphosphohydrolase